MVFQVVDKLLILDLLPLSAGLARAVLVLKLKEPSEFRASVRDQIINVMLENCSFLRPELVTILDSNGRKLSAGQFDGNFPTVATGGAIPPSEEISRIAYDRLRGAIVAPGFIPKPSNVSAALTFLIGYVAQQVCSGI